MPERLTRRPVFQLTMEFSDVNIASGIRDKHIGIVHELLLHLDECGYGERVIDRVEIYNQNTKGQTPCLVWVLTNKYTNEPMVEDPFAAIVLIGFFTVLKFSDMNLVVMPCWKGDSPRNRAQREALLAEGGEALTIVRFRRE